MLVIQIDSGFLNSKITTHVQVQQLQGFGYSAFAFGIFEDDAQFMSTTDASICSHPKVIQFLIGASMYLCHNS